MILHTIFMIFGDSNACTMIMTELPKTTSIDLGFNTAIDDSCDYHDYSTVETTPKFNGLAILQHNIRGVLGKQESLKLLLNDIRHECRVHVIMLAETWLKKNNAKRVKIPGYSFVGSHRKSKRGGGVGILMSQNLEYRQRQDLSLNIPNFESITVEMKTHQQSILFCTIYRPPNSSDRDFLKNYSRLIKKFTPRQLARLIIGLDHNLDLIKHSKHKVTNEFIELNLENQLLPTITKPTRITRTTTTLLDNIIVGRTFQSDYEPSIVISDISDHLPCLLKINNPSLFLKSPTKITTRALNNEKICELNSKLMEINWDEVLGNGSTSEQYTNFENILTNCIDEVAPYHTIKIPSNKIIKEPWLSVSLHKCHKKQQQLYKKTLKSTSTEEDQNKYKTYRNKLKQIVRRAREDFYRAKCTEYRKNTSRLWKMINKMTHKTQDKTNFIEYLKVDNQDYYEHKIIAEEFAKHFSQVGRKYAEQIPPSHKDIKHYLAQIPDNPKSIFMNPVSPTEIGKIID